jgi:anti-sigma factor RsiW
MTHDEIKEKIFALYDGPLTEQERTVAENHLGGCPDCRGAVSEYKKTAQLLFTLPVFDEGSEDRMVSAVLQQLPSSSRKVPASPWKDSLQWLVPLVGSAVAAAWIFFSILPDTPGLNSQPVADSFFSNDSQDSYSSLEASTAPPADRFVQTVVFNY